MEQGPVSEVAQDSASLLVWEPTERISAVSRGGFTEQRAFLPSHARQKRCRRFPSLLLYMGQPECREIPHVMTQRVGDV